MRYFEVGKAGVGEFSGLCPGCGEVVEWEPEKGGVVCPYCGFVLKEGSWTVERPEGEFRDWRNLFMVAVSP
jgi:hypothetical protein